MTFSPMDYLVAGQERLREAAIAQAAHAHVNAHICAGLAVECVLRAYRIRVQPDFEARHDLAQLSDSYLRRMSAKRRLELRDMILEVGVLWLNNHRYCGSGKLITHFNRINRYGKSRSILHANGERMIELATSIVEYGVARWNI